MQVAVFHPGTQHSWQTAYALQQLERLEWYATSIFYKPDSLPYLLERLPGPLGRRLGHEFSRFRHQGLDPQQVRTAGLAEWLERIVSRLGMRGAARRCSSRAHNSRATTTTRAAAAVGSNRFMAFKSEATT